MNLYFRLFLLFLLRRWRKGIGIMDVSELSYRVMPTDVDVLLHMNNGRYLTYMDLGRIDFMMRTGSFQAFREKGWVGIVGSTEAVFRRPLRPLAPFVLRTSLIGWDQKWFYFEHVFVSGGKEVCRGRAKLVLKDGKTTITPEAALASLGLNDVASPAMEPLRA